MVKTPKTLHFNFPSSTLFISHVHHLQVQHRTYSLTTLDSNPPIYRAHCPPNSLHSIHSSMARTGSATKLLLLRKGVSGKRVDHHEPLKRNEDSSCWVPHPRSGIYFPKGQEKVMDGVPAGAASFRQTYWLRNEDGVDKPDHDTPPDYYFHHINM